ncbi:uncharacterized protein DSM5745_03778 [Aspergillus mulundensis]|uniref:N-acetyltransferase domain-containing protein n=1 Tax=Aspergillus mulundensis TaxID=1810919 RepID=A0A3D8SLI2_9EURO|nr:hypothetical protein DSM5745_03778 [Aspergillus mulundensis]RDW87136.1 hypothetical protein DSM5745_03778 [Aspergillus mulundensis]
MKKKISEDEEEMSQDEDNWEKDVEDHEFVIQDKTNPAMVRLCRSDLDDPKHEQWAYIIHAKCTLDEKTVAHCSATVVFRESIRDEFWYHLDREIADTLDIAFKIFDRYGALQQKFHSQPVQRGSGAWGYELDTGVLFIIELLHVTARSLHGVGLGKTTVSLVLQKAQSLVEDKKSGHWTTKSNRTVERAWSLHALTLPGWLHEDTKTEIEGKSTRQCREIRSKAVDAAVGFWRSCGFRRIGASSCACCLETKTIPNQRTILDQLSRNTDADHGLLTQKTRDYLQSAGQKAGITTVVRNLLDRAKMYGTKAGKEVSIFESSEYSPPEEELPRLPACRNDREFGFVASMWGIYSPTFSIFDHLF